MADKLYLRESGEHIVKVLSVDAKFSSKGDPMLVVTLRRDDGAEINSYFVPKHTFMREMLVAFAKSAKPGTPEGLIVKAINDGLGMADPIAGLRGKFRHLEGQTIKIHCEPQRDNPKYFQITNFFDAPVVAESEDGIPF